MNDLRKDELIETLINLKKKDFVESGEASKNVLSGKSSPPQSMVQNSKKRKY